MTRTFLGVAMVALALAGLTPPSDGEQPSLSSSLILSGSATDLSIGAPGANHNRVGYFSDLTFDARTGHYYALGDRGPGGGALDYQTRVQRFRVTIDPRTGELGNFEIDASILLRDREGRPFNGLNPALLSGSPATLGNSLDSEGIAVGGDGHLFVADEYGPSIHEFEPVTAPDGTISEARLVRTFETPANLVPRRADGSVDHVAGKGKIVGGRQDNRGYEGLAITADGSTLVAVLQGPLVDEGPEGNGRLGRLVRIVRFDVASGTCTGQFLYPLESLDVINARVEHDFEPDQQGRDIGLSAIVAVDADRFLVLERDDRGLGAENAFVGMDPALSDIGSKRVYEIDLRGATDVTGLCLAGDGLLPSGVQVVRKSAEPFLDILAALRNAGLVVPDKLEGLAIGPRLADGSYVLLVGSDNDFSVTQHDDSPRQFDVWTDATGSLGGSSVRYTGLDDRSASYLTIEDALAGTHNQGAVPEGFTLIPSFLYSFKATLPGHVPLGSASGIATD